VEDGEQPGHLVTMRIDAMVEMVRTVLRADHHLGSRIEILTL
jgi:hypothetical protein